MSRWPSNGLTDEERFWFHVSKSDDCWLWTAKRNPQNYGRFWIGGHEVNATFYALKLSGVDVPKGQHVLHRCDNPQCVRPDHLFLGTQKDNMHDMYFKGRRRAAVGQGMAKKLTEIEVKWIRENHEGHTHSALAKHFGVHQSTISRIISHKRWKFPYGVTHVSEVPSAALLGS